MKIIPLTISKANVFVNQYHHHNKKTACGGGKFAIGADENGELVGVAIVGNPIARGLMDGFTAEVLRTCIRPGAPKNANSFLYAACWRIWQAMGGRRIVTYTLKTESGSSLKGAGWELVADVRGKTWNTTTRRRDIQPISLEPKWRWERCDK